MGFRPREKQTFSNVDIGRVTWPPAIRHTERLSERRQDWYRSFASVPPAQSIHYLHIRQTCWISSTVIPPSLPVLPAIPCVQRPCRAPWCSSALRASPRRVQTSAATP